jgi:uroporphyrinogen-III decarboxylase
MGHDACWQALNLQMPDRVPRTEYSADGHWPLIQAVTGIDTKVIANRPDGARAFVQAWDYAFMWSINVHRQPLARGRITDMGHAEYSEDMTGKSDLHVETKAPFSDPEEIYNLDMEAEYGVWSEAEIIADYHRHYREMQTQFPGPLHMAGVYITLFSGLIEIMGWDLLLMAIATDPERFGRFVERYARWIEPFFVAFAKSDVPVMMSHDDLTWTSGPVAHPDWYRQYLFPHLERFWTHVKDGGKKLIFTSDGDWTAFQDDIMGFRCPPDMVVMEPCCDMARFAAQYGKRCGFVGNADCRILLSGSKDDIEREVRRCMDIGKPYPGFVMAVGNHLPINTPVENALHYDEVYRRLAKR